MAGNPYFKSILWLASFGGLGYALLLLTAPSPEKLERIRASSSRAQLNEYDRKKQLFIERLQQEAGIKAASNGTPKKDN